MTTRCTLSCYRFAGLAGQVISVFGKKKDGIDE